MRIMNIFEILDAKKIQQGGTIHQIAEKAKLTTKKSFVNGLSCYKFRINGMYPCCFVDFDGCVDGRLIAEIPDKHLKGVKVAVQVVAEQKRIIEDAIL